MICAAHQPWFLPWLGFMHKLAACDVFVLLDQAQYNRRFYVNRVQLKHPDGLHWLTIPVASKGNYHAAIGDIEIAATIARRDGETRKLVASTIQHALGRAKHYDDLEELGERFDRCLHPGLLLADLNTELIYWLADAFGISTRIVHESELPSRGTRNERLISICRAVGADTYLSGRVAAREYMDDEAWTSAGISVEVQQLEHRPYPQLWGRPFRPEVSAIDLIANVGLDGARRWLERELPPVATSTHT